MLLHITLQTTFAILRINTFMHFTDKQYNYNNIKMNYLQYTEFQVTISQQSISLYLSKEIEKTTKYCLQTLQRQKGGTNQLQTLSTY